MSAEGWSLMEVADVIVESPRGSVWAVTPIAADARFARRLARELDLAYERDEGDSTAIVCVASELWTLAKDAPERSAIVCDLSSLDDSGLLEVELQRSRLVDGATIVFLLPVDHIPRIQRAAPNLWSWLQSSSLDVDIGIGQLDVEQRLDSLRRGTGLQDAQVVALAEARELPADPVFAEWLVLLGRGDLVVER